MQLPCRSHPLGCCCLQTVIFAAESAEITDVFLNLCGLSVLGGELPYQHVSGALSNMPPTRIGGAVVNNQDVAMLMLREGASPRRQWILQGAVTAMGRGEDCYVVIDDRRASRHHARITQTADGYVLEDLGSKNGTYLNGQRLAAPTVLKDGDEISIGFAAKLTFVDAGATAPLVFDASLGPSLHMDTAAKRVWVAGKELDPPLSLAQYRMLELLYQNQGEVVGREEVVSAVWAEDESEGVSEQAIDALARRLRERIAEADADNQYVITVRGHGFRLDHAD